VRTWSFWCVGACDGGDVMPIIMILYYLISTYIAALLIWNFIREKKSVNNMILYLLVLIPLILRLLRIR
jgi:hypothetical protein